MKNVGEFTLMNDEKVNRAIYGTLTRNGQLSGGVGEAAADALILAEYDRLGGHISKNGLKVQSGCFYDIRGRKPHAEPKIKFLINVDNDIVEGTEEEAAALQSARERIKEMKSRKKGTAASTMPTSDSGIFPSEDEPAEEPKGKRGRKAAE